MQLLPSIMPSVDSFGASAENKAFRIKSLLSKTSSGPDNGTLMVFVPSQSGSITMC